MNNIKKHIEMLGFKGKDKVTGYSGTITSVKFDLYGCIQAAVTPVYGGTDGKYPAGTWFDVTRIKITGKKPVMNMPDFGKGYVSDGKKGAAEIAFTPAF